jgi:hypothetical protein
MSYSKPGLPNFCNIGNSSQRNQWNTNKERNELNRLKNQNNLDDKMQKDIERKNLNLTNKEKGILYDRDYYRKMYGGFLPGENPEYALNNALPPDGNNINSNTGVDGRLKDSKNIYYKTYATTINLSLGILLSLYIIIKKPTNNI